MPEELLEEAIQNANENFKIVASSLPEHLVKKEGKLFEWYQKAKGNLSMRTKIDSHPH